MRHDMLIKLGTLSYNQSFVRRDFLAYAGSLGEFESLKRAGLIKPVEGRRWYPTAKGWEAIDAAYNQSGES